MDNCKANTKGRVKRRGRQFRSGLFMHSHRKIKTKWSYYSTGTGMGGDDGGITCDNAPKKGKDTARKLSTRTQLLLPLTLCNAPLQHLPYPPQLICQANLLNKFDLLLVRPYCFKSFREVCSRGGRTVAAAPKNVLSCVVCGMRNHATFHFLV